MEVKSVISQTNYERVTKKTDLRSYRLAVLLIGTSIVLFLFSGLLSGTYSPSDISEVNDSSFAETRMAPTSMATQLSNPLFYPGIAVLSIIFFILGGTKGILIHWQPESLSNLQHSTAVPFKQTFKNGKEILILKLNGGYFQLSWETTLGPPRRWKVSLKLKITDMKFMEQIKYLAMLMLMKSYENDQDNKETGIFYAKICSIYELPRQEYLLNYWLSKNDFTSLKN